MTDRRKLRKQEREVVDALAKAMFDRALPHLHEAEQEAMVILPVTSAALRPYVLRAFMVLLGAEVHTELELQCVMAADR